MAYKLWSNTRYYYSIPEQCIIVLVCIFCPYMHTLQHHSNSSRVWFLQPLICKLLEHIKCSNIMAHLDEHELLSDRQHAFRKWHSCETQLTTVINDWAKILDKKGQVDTFTLDFEKAFDTPPHELLKSKLFSYGIGGTTRTELDKCFPLFQTTKGSD